VFPLHVVFSPPSSTFLFTATATSLIYSLSLHDALPIYTVVNFKNRSIPSIRDAVHFADIIKRKLDRTLPKPLTVYDSLALLQYTDRKSTRLNSSHVKISYAVFCLKKKKTSITQ